MAVTVRVPAGVVGGGGNSMTHSRVPRQYHRIGTLRFIVISANSTPLPDDDEGSAWKFSPLENLTVIHGRFVRIQ